MLEACINGGWALRFDGRELVRHTQDAPFAVAVRQEKEYKSSRGTVKLTVREAERIPLTDAAQSATALFSRRRGIRCVWNTCRFPAARSFVFPARPGGATSSACPQSAVRRFSAVASSTAK